MEYNVIRGLGQIGGNAIEVTSNESRILLDVGRALDDKGNSDKEVIKVLSKSNYDAVLITHYQVLYWGKSLQDFNFIQRVFRIEHF